MRGQAAHPGGLLARCAGPLTAILALGYVAFFTNLNVQRYQTFRYHDFDLAIYAQAMWAILHGSIESSILGIPVFGNHLDVLLFLIAPLYALWASPVTLLVLQTLAIGLAVLPLYLLARERLDRTFALAFSAVYLSYPALHYVTTYEFHPDAFSIVFLLFMLYYFERGKFWPYAASLGAALTCKENISLGVSAFGVYVLCAGRRTPRWWLVPLVGGVAWGVVGLGILRSLNRGMIDFGVLYRHLHTTPLLEVLVTPANGAFLLQLFLPLAFVPLVAPKLLLVAAPFFLQQLLSARVTDHTIYYHYTAKLIPFLFVSAIAGAAQLTGPRRPIGRFPRRLVLGALLVAALVSNAWFGWVRALPRAMPGAGELDRTKQELIDRIPPDASVVATFQFQPKLSQRRSVYSFHHVYIGRYTLSADQVYRLPDDVQYALIDFDDSLTFGSFYHPEHYRNIQRFLAEGRWGLLAAADNIALLKRGLSSPQTLYEPLPQAPSASPTRLMLRDAITVLDHRLLASTARGGDVVPVTVVWQANRPMEEDYWLSVQVIDPEGQVLHQVLHPVCYRIYPTFAWRPGEVLRETLWVLIPPQAAGRQVTLGMVAFNRNDAALKGGSVPVIVFDSNTPSVFDRSGRVVIGTVQVTP